jgi:hypothetical protein
MGWICHLVAYWWLHLMCIILDIMTEYFICFWFKKGFWFTANIGCTETDGSSSAVLRAVADILTHYCIVFQRWQRRFQGEDNIVLYIYILTVTLVHWMSDTCIGYCVHFQRWCAGFWGQINSWSHTNWWRQHSCSAFNVWYSYRIFNATWICI